MFVSINWIKEYVDLSGLDIKKLIESFTLATAEVEDIIVKGEDIKNVVVGAGTKHKSQSTGELVGALGLSPVKPDKAGNHDIKVGFAEPRSDGGSNAKIANILEYGKHGQPAKPFLKPAKTASRAECIQTMKDTLEAEVQKL